MPAFHFSEIQLRLVKWRFYESFNPNAGRHLQETSFIPFFACAIRSNAHYPIQTAKMSILSVDTNFSFL